MTGLAKIWAVAAFLGLTAVVTTAPARPARADSAQEIDAKVDIALNALMAESQTAATLAPDAKAILVFPSIVKAGFGIGGQYGEGALRRDGVTVGYYNLASASFGFQAGAQSYSQAMFFMTDQALRQFENVNGFEIGADANVAVMNEGAGIDVTTNTLQDPIIAFVYGQSGLMAGVTVEGSKITKIRPK